MSIIKEFNQIGKTLLTADNRPYLGGWRGDIYKANDGRVFAHLQRDLEPEILGIVPARYADMADGLEYNPYDDAAYARRTIALTENALRSAECWQIPKHKTQQGNCPLIPDYEQEELQ